MPAEDSTARAQHDAGGVSRIAVLGLGAIGGVVAAELAALGRHAVVVCTREPLQRLNVQRPQGTLDLPMQALTDPAQATPVDWVLLCTKAHQTASVAPWLAQLCAAGTRVAVLQNGIGHAQRVGPFIGRATVVPTIVYYNGERMAPDRMRLRPAGQYELAVEDSADGQAFAALLDGSVMRLLQTDDLATLAWRKLLINAVANPVTALTLQRQAVFRRADIAALCLDILEEAAAVGRADGARLTADEPAAIMRTLLTYPADAGTSMYFDRQAGRALEVEALTGNIVARGLELGVRTPLNRLLLTLLRAISDSAVA